MRIDLSSPDIEIVAVIWAKIFEVFVVEVCHDDTLFLLFAIITYLEINEINWFYHFLLT